MNFEPALLDDLLGEVPPHVDGKADMATILLTDSISCRANEGGCSRDLLSTTRPSVS